MPAREMFANFPPEYAGLATVGYRLWTASGGFGSRVTAGVTNVSAALYRASVTFPDGFVGIIVWDTAAGSGIEAPEAVDLTADLRTADAVLKRSTGSAFASAEGGTPVVSSLLGMIQQGQKAESVGSAWRVYAPDGTTLGNIELTASAGADPVTGVSVS
jgi:hypothetical protein